MELSQTGEAYESKKLEKLESENRCFETIEDRSSHNKLKVKNREEKKNSKKHFYEEIIGYLNAKCNKNYKCTTGKTQRCINARLREGNSLDDFTPKVGSAKK
ncbi:conserved phage C-terminal domain-containing protein [Clostridium gasigenes]|uniref:conserved phage C-terminal domain-containing protein n=1 Tax=Clostridium gasigenes TaxID=94869 RepID=UPI001A9BC7DD|nr:conserved phage C-terminal domain-containing protein [Clostridium gasigenes]